MTPVDRVIPILILHVYIGMSVLNEPGNTPKMLVINTYRSGHVLFYSLLTIYASGSRPISVT